MDFRIEKKDAFQIMGLAGFVSSEKMEWEGSLWCEFIDEPGIYNTRLRDGNPSYYTAPLWQVGAYDYQSVDGKTPTIIGAEYKGRKPDIEGISIKDIPAAIWIVFSIKGATGPEAYDRAFTRILTEWFPTSTYKRDESIPNLDVYPGGAIDENYVWEIWMPVLNK